VPSDPQRDHWLSDVLGFDVYWVKPDAAAQVRDTGRALYTCKVPAEDVVTGAALAEAGFRVVDVNVTLERRGDVCASGAPVAPATASQHEALLEIAGSCFRYSRFHLDPLIPREVADRVKREWVRSYVEGRRGIELLASADGQRPNGFLAVLEAPDGARVIDLVGVAPDTQRQGIGKALVVEFVRRHADGARTLRVGTQAANIPSLRLYEKLGFRTVSAAFVLHRHTGA